MKTFLSVRFGYLIIVALLTVVIAILYEDCRYKSWVIECKQSAIRELLEQRDESRKLVEQKDVPQ